ncbi:Inner membrane protein YqaA (plasmid) [Pseudoseohaeicola sp. NH-UV-7]|uniref:YqaA family protein n=1 Tax=Sulfitobacter sp. TBRI5 TaxID=2989732 RepID=UPI003A7142CC
MAEMIWPLAGLFLISLSAATLLPGGSEAALLALASLSTYSALTLLVVASTGNILGSILNYLLGRIALRFQDRVWFPASASQLEKAQNWFSRWGYWAVLLAWMPLIGDPITVAAGVLRMGFGLFLLLVTISKTLRYMVVLGLFNLFA